MSKNNTLDIVIESESFKQFLQEARVYCKYIEEEKETGNNFLKTIRFHLLNLYQYILKVHSIDIEYDYNSPGISNEEYKRIESLISPRIPVDYYFEVFDPLDMEKHEPVCGSLIDDLSDIYRDIKDSINDYDTGKIEAIEDAVFNFKESFESHWGNHLVSALKTIHWYICTNSNDE